MKTLNWSFRIKDIKFLVKVSDKWPNAMNLFDKHYRQNYSGLKLFQWETFGHFIFYLIFSACK